MDQLENEPASIEGHYKPLANDYRRNCTVTFAMFSPHSKKNKQKSQLIFPGIPAGGFS